MSLFLAFHWPWAETMTPVTGTLQASQPFILPSAPKTKQDSLVADGFGLFSVRFFNDVYVRNLLRFFLRYFVHSTLKQVRLQEDIKGKQLSLSFRLIALAQCIVPVDQNTGRYCLWCDSQSEAVTHNVKILTSLCAVKPAVHWPDDFCFIPVMRIKVGLSIY